MTLYFPPTTTDEWERVAPSEAGWDAARLDEALAFAESRSSTQIVVLHRGRIVAEGNWRGADVHTAADVASVQKSVVSFVFGVMRHAGLVGLDSPVSGYLGTGWSQAPHDHESRVLMRHLLTMTTGLDDRLEAQADVGTLWRYNTNATHRIKTVLERVTGRSTEDLFRECLLAPIGMRDSSWRARPGGSLGLFSTARDLARFGLCVLAGGTWDGNDVVRDHGYLSMSLESSQHLNPSYGHLWWLNGKSAVKRPGRDSQLRPGPLVPAAPADLVAALGAADKKVYVVPSRGLVVTRCGGRGREQAAAVSSFDAELWGRLLVAAPAV